MDQSSVVAREPKVRETKSRGDYWEVQLLKILRDLADKQTNLLNICQHDLMELTGAHTQALQKAIKTLIAKGKLEIRAKHGRRTATLFYVAPSSEDSNGFLLGNFLKKGSEVTELPKVELNTTDSEVVEPQEAIKEKPEVTDVKDVWKKVNYYIKQLEEQAITQTEEIAKLSAKLTDRDKEIAYLDSKIEVYEGLASQVIDLKAELTKYKEIASAVPALKAQIAEYKEIEANFAKIVSSVEIEAVEPTSKVYILDNKTGLILGKRIEE